MRRSQTSRIILFLSFAACTGDTDDSDDTNDACSPTQVERCLYDPGDSFETNTSTLEIIDATRLGGNRIIPLTLLDPSDADDGLPVLFLSPGAPMGDGNNPSANSVNAWASHFSEAGYLAIIVDHRRRNPEALEALCTELALTGDACNADKLQSWDRPQDISAVLDWLQSDAPSNTWRTRTASSTFGHTGQEAGAATGLMLAGANRKFGQTSEDFTDSRIEAIVPIAMVSEADDTFLEAGLAQVQTPVYMSASIHNYDSSERPVDYLTAFSALPEGNKYLLHFLDEDATGSTFSLSDCEAGECAMFQSWLTSSSLAFTDAILQEQQSAITWLATGDMVTAVGSQADWLTR